MKKYYARDTKDQVLKTEDENNILRVYVLPYEKYTLGKKITFFFN